MSGYCAKEIDVVTNASMSGFTLNQTKSKALSIDFSSTFPDCSTDLVILDKSTYTQMTTLDYGSLGITESTLVSAFSFGFMAIATFWVVAFTFRLVVELIRKAK